MVKLKINTIQIFLLFSLSIIIWGSPLSGEEDTCGKCHKNIEAGVVRHPALEDGCSICHEIEMVKGKIPHKVTQISSVNELCQMCHNIPEDPENIHPPIETEGCTFCHNPHSSAYSSLLKETPYTLCGRCHRATLPSTYLTRHSPVEKGCGNCHNVHGSGNSKFLKVYYPELCYRCHPSVKEEVNALNPHPPAEEDCMNCHTPHSSSNTYLLNAFYPQGPYQRYTPLKYDLCWQCHDKDEVLDNNSGFTTALWKNLHRVHTVQKKGRICTLCHSPHGSSQSYLLRTKIPFGKAGWAIPLEFSEGEKEKICGPTCHESRSYLSR